MSRLVGIILLIGLYTGIAAGMDCPATEQDNFLEKVSKGMSPSCPRAFDDPDKSFCCVDVQRSTTYCCDAEEFAKTGLVIIIPVVIGAILVGLIMCCISCLCCSCCPWYRRRHRGTVYGKVQTPVVQVIQPPPVNLPPSYPGQSVESNYTPYPTNSTGMPQPPPPYSNEAYAKQAPYNPAFSTS